MWTKILSFLLDKDNHRFILLVALIGALAFGSIQCDRKQEFKAEVDRQINNIEALNDSVSYYENRAGELTAQRLALQSDLEQLETLNQELYNEVQNERETVEQLTQINAELRSDTARTTTTDTVFVENNTYRFNWNLSRSGDQWERVLEGYTQVHLDTTGVPDNSETFITRDLIRMQIITGITENNGQRSIFVRSTYPDLSITNIQGAIIQDNPIEDRNRSRFGLGVNLGAGYVPAVGITPTVSLGINYNLINF